MLKETGAYGFRFDAVKHISVSILPLDLPIVKPR